LLFDNSNPDCIWVYFFLKSSIKSKLIEVQNQKENVFLINDPSIWHKLNVITFPLTKEFLFAIKGKNVRLLECWNFKLSKVKIWSQENQSEINFFQIWVGILFLKFACGFIQASVSVNKVIFDTVYKIFIVSLKRFQNPFRWEYGYKCNMCKLPAFKMTNCHLPDWKAKRKCWIQALLKWTLLRLIHLDGSQGGCFTPN